MFRLTFFMAFAIACLSLTSADQAVAQGKWDKKAAQGIPYHVEYEERFVAEFDFAKHGKILVFRQQDEIDRSGCPGYYVTPSFSFRRIPGQHGAAINHLGSLENGKIRSAIGLVITNRTLLAGVRDEINSLKKYRCRLEDFQTVPFVLNRIEGINAPLASMGAKVIGFEETAEGEYGENLLVYLEIDEEAFDDFATSLADGIDFQLEYLFWLDEAQTYRNLHALRFAASPDLLEQFFQGQKEVWSSRLQFTEFIAEVVLENSLDGRIQGEALATSLISDAENHLSEAAKATTSLGGLLLDSGLTPFALAANTTLLSARIGGLAQEIMLEMQAEHERLQEFFRLYQQGQKAGYPALTLLFAGEKRTAADEAEEEYERLFRRNLYDVVSQNEWLRPWDTSLDEPVYLLNRSLVTDYLRTAISGSLTGEDAAVQAIVRRHSRYSAHMDQIKVQIGERRSIGR